MEGDDEEDTEVVLKGSELYNHLLNCSSDGFDIYDKNDIYDRERQSENIIRPQVTKVPKELLTYLDAILNSNLLLDEDVTYLYGYTVDLISDHKANKYLGIICSTVLGLCSFTTAIAYNSLFSADHFMKVYLNIKCHFNKWKRIHLLTNLIATVKQLHLYFKKTSQILYEQNAYFKLHELKSKTNGQTDEFNLLEKKKKAEVDLLSSILYQCFLENVHRTREVTKQLMEKLPLVYPVDSKGHYLVFLSDAQLGLSDNIDNDQCTLSAQSLDSLKNIYLLMQSEFFRRLGLCFCPTLWSKENSSTLLPFVFDIIYTYLKSCQDILSVIKFYYRKHVFPEKVNRQKQRDSIHIGSYSAVHKISTSLTELVIDSRVLEEYVENLKTFEEREINSISLKLEQIKIGLNSCIDNLIFAEKYFSKLRPIRSATDKETEENKNDLENDKHIESTEIGKKPNDIASEDHVYFAITEGRREADLLDEPADLEPAQLPNFILTELKEALIQKRNEFTVRENKAVENVDEYKKFLDTPETKPKVIKRTKYETPVENIPTSDLHLHKMLASAVAQRSANFINRKEEQFGSSDDSD